MVREVSVSEKSSRFHVSGFGFHVLKFAFYILHFEFEFNSPEGINIGSQGCKSLV
jgi:hypothetical protein